MRLVRLAMVVLAMVGATARGEGALTLEIALQEATQRSPEIQRARAAAQESSWKRFEAFGAGFLPHVSVSALHYFDTKYSQTSINFGGNPLLFPGFYPNTQAALDVSLPIFNGLANLRHWQSASLLEDAGEKELSQAEFEVAESVRLAFYKALAANELREVSRQNVKTLEDHLRQVKVRRQGGEATRYDALRVEVQLSEARADAIDTEDNALLARKKLAELLGLDRDERTIEGTLPVPEATQVRALEFSEVPKDRADIEALNLKATAADRASSASGAWLVPSIYLAGQYAFYDQQLFDQTVQNTGNFKSSYNVGVFMKWNLFDGGVALAQAREAAYRTVQAEKTAQIAKLKAPYDFAYWKRRYLSNTDHYLSKKFDIERSEESVRLAKEEERAGARTSTETLDAELDLFRARAGVVNAQVNASEAQIRLELALGRRI